MTVLHSHEPRFTNKRNRAVTLDHISSGEKGLQRKQRKLTQFRALLAKIKQKAVEGL